MPPHDGGGLLLPAQLQHSDFVVTAEGAVRCCECGGEVPPPGAEPCTSLPGWTVPSAAGEVAVTGCDAAAGAALLAMLRSGAALSSALAAVLSACPVAALPPLQKSVASLLRRELDLRGSLSVLVGGPLEPHRERVPHSGVMHLARPRRLRVGCMLLGRRWQYAEWTDGGERVVACHGMALRVRPVHAQPPVQRIRGFATPAECAHLIALCEGRWERSKTVDAASEVAAPTRTSCSTKLRVSEPVVRRMLQRACYLSGLTPQHAEAVQAVRYRPGQEYRAHWDYFEPGAPGFEERTAPTRRSGSGQRAVTFFVVLQAPEGGGATEFPRLQLSVPPESGTALHWSNLLDLGTGEVDPRTLHAGVPVTAGTKYGLNIWLRQRPRGQQ
eukprot:TRINITY_DN6815_c0_g1_i4.p1 TRINITY_DN6815_c0_g1~~TRINITY_DN6815_c0_g1_i4.p1  ORF type:complete len:385 (+),score=70.69 TRINITY_DN6815_c0_g1_i4:63-1217(+)